MAADIEGEFREVKREKKIVDVLAFSRMRDYLLIRVMLASAQRCGAAANLTVEEYRNGEWASKFSKPMYVTSTLRHKTEASGSASLFWDSKVKELADIYVNFLRPCFANSQSLLPAVPGVPSTAAFFITSNGSTLSASRVSRCIMRIAKRLHPELEGNLKGSRIRKGVISLDRENLRSSTTTKSMLARQMTHSTTTADRYYAVNSKLEEKGRVAEYIESLMLPASSKEKRHSKKVKVLEEESSSESEVAEEGNEGTLQKESVRESEDIVERDIELCEPADGEEKENDDEDIEVEGEKIAEEDDDGKQMSVEEEKLGEEKEIQKSDVEMEREERDSEEKGQMREPIPVKRDGLSVEKKKELLRIFGSKHLGKGIVPPRHIVQFRAARNLILKKLNVDDAMEYLKRKSKSDLPGKLKVFNWVSSQGKSINKIETSSTASSFPGRRFTEYQGEIIHNATASLPDNAKMRDIIDKLKTDKDCKEYGICDMFTRQQLRDKFVNIRKKLKKTNF